MPNLADVVTSAIRTDLNDSEQELFNFCSGKGSCRASHGTDFVAKPARFCPAGPAL